MMHARLKITRKGHKIIEEICSELPKGSHDHLINQLEFYMMQEKAVQEIRDRITRDLKHIIEIGVDRIPHINQLYDAANNIAESIDNMDNHFESLGSTWEELYQQLSVEVR